MQHGGTAQLCVRRQTSAVHFVEAAFVRIDLLAGGGKFLDGEFLEAFANPVEARRCAGIFKRKNEEDPALRKRRGAGRCGGSALLARRRIGTEKNKTTKKNQRQTAVPLPPFFHEDNILTEAAGERRRYRLAGLLQQINDTAICVQREHPDAQRTDAEQSVEQRLFAVRNEIGVLVKALSVQLKI